ncbi:MAG: geranylgeranylglyceryl/heptaprenylglyceryl phosphate synthase [Fibrobacteres bacterium]|nr:geranylgeranylglyceryl/heptaprenylglyceryl phosphate synthase [Fibrobacterota bacterium]
MTVYEKVFLSAKNGRAAHVVLLDPDKLTKESAGDTASRCSKAGVDALFVGGSTASPELLNEIVYSIKENSSIPVILFPGGADQIVKHADAILFMSLLSGRNPRFLVEEPLKGVHLIRDYNIETIGMGYLLIESDKPSAVERVSQTNPLPRSKPELAADHALMAQYFGMKAVYLEGGSGVGLPVPLEMIQKVKEAISIPLITGGGLRTPEAVTERVKCGADIIVTGNVLEAKGTDTLLNELVSAVHTAR